jgi:hypothetical protein
MDIDGERDSSRVNSRCLKYCFLPQSLLPETDMLLAESYSVKYMGSKYGAA